jgi:hypothetical protein
LIHINTGFSIRLRERNEQRAVSLGVTLPLWRHLSIEPSLVRQVDWVLAGTISNAIGLTLIASF